MASYCLSQLQFAVTVCCNVTSRLVFFRTPEPAVLGNEVEVNEITSSAADVMCVASLILFVFVHM